MQGKALDPNILVTAVKALRQAEKAGGSQRDACDICSEMLGRPVNFNTYRRWLMMARDAAPEVTPPPSIPDVERNLCDYTQLHGWWRDRPRDKAELVYRDGELVGSRNVIDPGMIYPPGWDGPLFRDKPKTKAQAPDGVQRFLLTSIQDQTPAIGPFMVNLRALAIHLNADMKIGQFTYAKNWHINLFGGGVRDKRRLEERDTVRDYPADLSPWLTCDRHELAENLWFAAEPNIRPTAQHPMSAMQTYGKGRSVVYPHPKQELESVPRDPLAQPVFVATTGCCNPPNYVKKKEGYKAAFHHVVGAFLIEIDADGYIYSHHIHADAFDGSFQVYDIRVDRGVVTTGHEIPGCTFGDGHVEHLDPGVGAATFGIGKGDDTPMIDALKIRECFVHDVFDFYTRNHHNRADPFHQFKVYLSGRSISDEIAKVVDFLSALRRPWMQIHAVESNHDLALYRWLKEADWRSDPMNARLYHQLNDKVLEWLERNEKKSIFEYAVRKHDNDNVLDAVHFIPETGPDASHLVEGVQCGWHGHLGPAGKPGTTAGFLGLAQRISKDHDHTPTKKQGVTSGGTCQVLMPDYAKGPTKWAHAHTLIYPGGHTSIVFIHAGRWRALGWKRQPLELEQAA
jgi:hypothetical protein